MYTWIVVDIRQVDFQYLGNGISSIVMVGDVAVVSQYGLWCKPK